MNSKTTTEEEQETRQKETHQKLLVSRRYSQNYVDIKTIEKKFKELKLSIDGLIEVSLVKRDITNETTELETLVNKVIHNLLHGE